MLWAVAFAAAPVSCLAADGTLFDAKVGTDPTMAMWGWHGTGDKEPSTKNAISTSAQRRDRQGWWLELDKKAKATAADFRFTFDLKSEVHASGNRAGLTIAFTDDQGRSAVINIWEKEAWLCSSDPLNGHGESVALRPGTTHNLTLTHSSGYAAVEVDGERIGRVPLRDFSGIPSDLDGYLKPGTLFFGDASTAAGCEATLQSVKWNDRALDLRGVGGFLVGILGSGAAFGCARLWFKMAYKRPSGRVYIDRR